MSDPGTWALVLGTAAGGVGTGLSAMGAIRQGQATANAERYNAEIAKQNAQIADAQGVSAVEAQQRDSQRRIGASIAAYGASGVSLVEGSPVDVLAESARNATLDAATLKYNYKLKGLGYSNQAELSRTNAVNSMTAAYLSAAGAVASGMSQSASSAIPMFG